MNEEIKKIINNITSMSDEERKEQLSWSDTHEFGTAYAYFLLEENQKLNKIIEDIDKYIHIFKIEDIGEKTMLILNDILLIKNGLGEDVVRLNKLTELKKEVE